MKKQKLLLLSILACGTLFVISCKTQKKAATEEACATPNQTYSGGVKAIIESKCAVEGCHDKGRGDFRVFENFKRKVDQGEVKEMVVIKKTMPPNEPLSSKEIKRIECWLKDGGKEN